MPCHVSHEQEEPHEVFHCDDKLRLLVLQMTAAVRRRQLHAETGL